MAKRPPVFKGKRVAAFSAVVLLEKRQSFCHTAKKVDTHTFVSIYLHFTGAVSKPNRGNAYCSIARILSLGIAPMD